MIKSLFPLKFTPMDLFTIRLFPIQFVILSIILLFAAITMNRIATSGGQFWWETVGGSETSEGARSINE